MDYRHLNEVYTWDQASIITEGGGYHSDGKEKELYLKGLFVQGGVKNHNQRVYPVSEIKSAVDQINAVIKRGETVWGESDHPEGLNINLDRISHNITEMWMDGPNGFGKLKIIPTPQGKIVRILIESGGKLGVSSRGSGNVDDSTGEVSDFEIITVDIVARPSAPNAFPTPVFERYNDMSRYNVSEIFNVPRRGSKTYDLAEAAIHDPAAQKHIERAVLEWMDKLNLRG